MLYYVITSSACLVDLGNNDLQNLIRFSVFHSFYNPESFFFFFLIFDIVSTLQFPFYGWERDMVVALFLALQQKMLTEIIRTCISWLI